jgi:predicted Zn-ribbon and HTH transcriptional regulator
MKRQRTTPQMTRRLGERLPFNLWKCKKCGRENLQRYIKCPKCETQKEEERNELH